MKPGTKRTPASLKRLRGSFRAGRDGKRGPEPLAPGALLDPPPWLTAAQAKRFREILADAPANLLRRWDAAMLAGYVIAESRVIEGQGGGPALVRSSHGDGTLSAAAKLQARFLPLMRHFASELGFSPASRASLRVEESASDPDAARWQLFDEISAKIEENNQTALLAMRPASPQEQ
jgi:phage terminase small subunit